MKKVCFHLDLQPRFPQVGILVRVCHYLTRVAPFWRSPLSSSRLENFLYSVCELGELTRVFLQFLRDLFV